MEKEHDEDYFYGILASLGYDLYLCKLMYSVVETKNIEDAKDWLNFSQSKRDKLEYLINQNRNALEEKLNQGLTIIMKILTNITQFPDNPSYRSLKYERYAE